MKILPLQIFPKINSMVLRLMGHDVAKGVMFYSSSEVIGLVKVSIGENSFVGHKSLIMGGDSTVYIGKNCDISSNVSIITGTHEVGGAERRAGAGFCKDVFIGDGTWIGYGSTILGGVKIGEGCIVGAGTLVNKDVPPNVIVGGVPFKILKQL